MITLSIRAIFSNLFPRRNPALGLRFRVRTKIRCIEIVFSGDLTSENGA